MTAPQSRQRAAEAPSYEVLVEALRLAFVGLKATAGVSASGRVVIARMGALLAKVDAASSQPPRQPVPGVYSEAQAEELDRAFRESNAHNMVGGV